MLRRHAAGSARQTTHMWFVSHTCRQPLLASRAALPVSYRRMHEQICTLYTPAVKHTLSSATDGSKGTATGESTWGSGMETQTQIQTAEDVLQSRCIRDRPVWWELCLKRSEWSSYQMIMSLFSLWKSEPSQTFEAELVVPACASAERAEGVPHCENIMKLDSDKWFRSRLSAGQRLFYWR